MRKNLYVVPLFLYALAVLTPVVGKITHNEIEYVSTVLVLGLLVIALTWRPLLNSFKKLKLTDYVLYLPSLAFFQILLIVLIVIVLNATGHTSTSLMSANGNFLDTINNHFNQQSTVIILNQLWIGLVGPIVENILFIYLIQGQLLKKLGDQGASRGVKILQVIIVTGLFMCWHLNSLHNFVDPGFYRYVALAWLPLVYLKTQSLAKTVVAHIGLNLVVIILYFI